MYISHNAKQKQVLPTYYIQILLRGKVVYFSGTQSFFSALFLVNLYTWYMTYSISLWTYIHDIWHTVFPCEPIYMIYDIQYFLVNLYTWYMTYSISLWTCIHDIWHTVFPCEPIYMIYDIQYFLVNLYTWYMTYSISLWTKIWHTVVNKMANTFLIGLGPQ